MTAFLGIDLGTIALHLAVMDGEGALLHSSSISHKGDAAGALENALRGLPPLEISASAVTGTGVITGAGSFLDPVVAILEGAKHFVPDLKNVIYIGAGSYHLIRLRPDGEYLTHSSNTACASGTGSFLDQQSVRLGFDSAALAAEAQKAERVPRIATRCAVFAKTDIIHLQQEGYVPREVAAGLCKGLAGSAVDVLLRGRMISGKTVLCGGVALNKAVVKNVGERLGFGVVVPPHPDFIPAVGAALHARRVSNPELFNAAAVCVSAGRRGGDAKNSETLLRPPLEMSISKYPDFSAHQYYVDESDSEITVPEPIAKGAVRCVMGLDIGSTSTKALLMSPDKKVVAHVYRKTAGDPIKATKLVFHALLELEKSAGVSFEIFGSATTGSGRKFIRKVISADVERDEITAHARAAAFLDPEVDTILEIGGQDSKFTQLSGGVVYNSVMNYVCAAGTGSFIEEQAVKLAIPLSDYSDFVMGVRAPITSDRCTVFMSRDLERMLASGYSKKEAAAAVLHSVRDNYLNKVVSGLKIGDRVYFQGATARNKALVAAFEMELGKPIAVSKFCHVTGALGLCLMLLEDLPQKSTFRGLKFADEDTRTETEICDLCNNHCTLTLVRTPKETVGWGFKCGREYGVDRRVVKPNPDYHLFKERERLLHKTGNRKIENPKFRVGYPEALTFQSYLPFWRAFFGELGCELVSSGRSSQELYRRGQAFMTAEFCAPVVLALGHAEQIIRKNEADFFLFPYMIREDRNEDFSNNYFCPYVEGHSTVVKNIFSIPDERLLAPVLVLDFPDSRTVNRLFSEIGHKMQFTRSSIKKAFNAAKKAQHEFLEKCREAGKNALEELAKSGKNGVVVLGRPYNTCESTLNLDLPEKIAEKGIAVFPAEFIPADFNGLADYSNMYWNYGQKLLGVSNYVMKSNNLFPVFITNFSCGPDSYIITYAKEILARRKKPILILQLDALGGDAGYLTRVESALESFKAWKPVPEKPPGLSKNPDKWKDKVCFIPPMDPVGVQLFAAAFRGFGYDARVMPENDETLSNGYRHTLGGECVPCPATVGSFITALEKSGVKPENAVFFMPTAKGPCRFGQYSTLSRIVFKARGWDTVSILSPSAGNAYQGLQTNLRTVLWEAILAADIMNKMTLKVRPCEKEPGATDSVLRHWIKEMVVSFEKMRLETADVLGGAAADFASVKRTNETRPKVGVVGEIYVRSSDFLNQDVCRTIEKLGGEAVKTSLAEWFLYADFIHRKFAKERGELIALAKAKMANWYLTSREKFLYKAAGPLIADRHDPPIEEVIDYGMRYMPYEFRGEAILTVGRAVRMIEKEGARAVVNANPTFCMPGTVSAAIFPVIEAKYGVPIISNFYDGSGSPNAALVPHMFYLSGAARSGGVSRTRPSSVGAAINSPDFMI
jgi:predicted CoA-substrate-specific enzyme activase